MSWKKIRHSCGKAHRWYSAFRNVGIWAICVVAAWGSPERSKR